MGEGTSSVGTTAIVHDTHVMPRVAGQEAEVTPGDIAQTREEMSGTIAALGEKLSPHHLAEEAKEAIPELASHLVQHAKDAITEAAASAAQHAKDTVTEAIHQMREHLPEIASQSAHRAIHGAVDGVKSATNKIVDSSKEAFGGAATTAKGVSMSVVENIKQNPIPALITGVGLYLLFRGGQENKNIAPAPMINPQQSSGYADGSLDGYGYNTGRYYGPGDSQTVRAPYVGTIGNSGNIVQQATGKIGEVAGQVQNKAGDMAHQVQDKAGNLVHQVQGTAGNFVHQVQDTAGNIAHQVQDKTGQIADQLQNTAGTVSTQVQQKAQQGGDWFQTTLEENPLAIGALAVGLGVLIGLALPGTPVENQLMGETRDNLKDNLTQKAQEAAHTISDKVQSVAHEAISTVKEEAQKQGISLPTGEPSNA